MKGAYGGYDGPCPPWNDEIVHHYHFAVYALDVPSLGLDGRFTGPDALRALAPHTIAKGTFMGTYSLNPQVRAAGAANIERQSSVLRALCVCGCALSA